MGHRWRLAWAANLGPQVQRAARLDEEQRMPALNRSPPRLCSPLCSSRRRRRRSNATTGNGFCRGAPERWLPPPLLLPHPPRRRDIGNRRATRCARGCGGGGGGGGAGSAATAGRDPLGEVRGHLHAHVSTPYPRSVPCAHTTLSVQTRVIRDYPFPWIRLLRVIHSPIRINLCRKSHVNVGTIGHVDHGKCVRHGQLVILQLRCFFHFD
jgi:hypothetical protein